MWYTAEPITALSFGHLHLARAMCRLPLSGGLALESFAIRAVQCSQGVLILCCRVSQPLQLIFYGDDVTVEQYQGGCEHPGCAKGPAIFKKYFGEWHSAAFGIAGAYPDPDPDLGSK